MISVRIPEGPITEILSAEAGRRNCKPEQLALSLLHCASHGGLFEAVLDGFDPTILLTPRNDRRSLQIRVIRALPSFKAPNGTILASITDITQRLDYSSRGAVRNALLALMNKHLVALVERGTPGKPSRYRLTEQGEAFLREVGRR